MAPTEQCHDSYAARIVSSSLSKEDAILVQEFVRYDDLTSSDTYTCSICLEARKPRMQYPPKIRVEFRTLLPVAPLTVASIYLKGRIATHTQFILTKIVCPVANCLPCRWKEKIKNTHVIATAYPFIPYGSFTLGHDSTVAQNDRAFSRHSLGLHLNHKLLETELSYCVCITCFCV